MKLIFTIAGMVVASAVALVSCARDVTPAHPATLFPSGATVAPGSKIESHDFVAAPMRFYKFECRVRSPAPAFVAALWRNPDATWGRDLQGRPGDLRAEDYQPVAASDEWQTVVFYSRAQSNATAGCLRVQALDGTMEVESARVSGPSPAAEVLAWSETLLDGVNVPAASGSGTLPRTAAALREGSTLRIVFLGDSIMQDAANAPIDLEMEFGRPGFRVEVITAIGGGAGMERWNDPGKFPGHDLNLQAAVIDRRPDLVVIGGISNGGDYDSVRAVITRIQDGALSASAPAPDILLMTGPFGEWAKASAGPTEADEEDARQLRAIAADMNIAFFDLRREWINNMTQAIELGHDPAIFYRDAIHGNAAGKNLQGHLIAARLKSAGTPDPSR